MNGVFQKLMRKLKGGQKEALLCKLWLAAGGEKTGEDGLAAILRDELSIQLVDVMLKLVGINGQFIPFKDMNSADDYIKANHDYRFVQPDINAFEILSRLQQFFVGQTFVSAEDFSRRVAELTELLQAMKQMRGLLNGVHFPICMPQMNVGDDYGDVLERVFVDALRRSYEARFAERTFINYRKGTLSKQVGIVEESRHGQLIEKMKSGPVVGLYFPNPMQGYGIQADRKLIQACPEGFLLTGAIDTAVAIVAKPDVLARDVNTPVLDCAANLWRSSGDSLYFYAYDGKLLFDYRYLDPSESCSGGVLFVG